MAQGLGRGLALAMVAALALGACGRTNEDTGTAQAEAEKAGWDYNAEDLNPGSTLDGGSGVQQTVSVDTFTNPNLARGGTRLSDSAAAVAAAAVAASAQPDAVRRDSAQAGAAQPGTPAPAATDTGSTPGTRP